MGVSYIFYGILSLLFWPAVIIGIIVFFVRRRRRQLHPSQDKAWYWRCALSREDAVSQMFLLLSFFFFGVTLLAFNRDFGELVSWRTILFITVAAGLIGAYSLKAVYTLAFSLIGLAGWWGAQAAQWIDGKNIKTSTVFAGLAFLALLFFSLGHLHEKQMRFKRFALVYLILGIFVVTGALFFLSTKSGIGAIEEMTKGALFLGSWEITVSLFIFLASLFFVTLYSSMQKLLSPFEAIAVFALACLFGITALLPAQTMFAQGRTYSHYYGGELSNAGILWALVYNFAVFFELVAVILSGYLRRESYLINLGAVFMFILIIVKYFDWFFSSLDKSIFFIGAGILLFVVGWFMEKGRRYMISNIKEQAQ